MNSLKIMGLSKLTWQNRRNSYSFLFIHKPLSTFHSFSIFIYLRYIANNSTGPFPIQPCHLPANSKSDMSSQHLKGANQFGVSTGLVPMLFLSRDGKSMSCQCNCICLLLLLLKKESAADLEQNKKTSK